MQISKYGKMKYFDKVLFSYRWHQANTIQNTSKIEMYTQKTRKYEEEILNNLKDKKVFKEVYEIKKYGLLKKKRGISNVFEILTYKKDDKKIKVIKIFNITIGLG